MDKVSKFLKWAFPNAVHLIASGYFAWAAIDFFIDKKLGFLEMNHWIAICVITVLTIVFDLAMPKDFKIAQVALTIIGYIVLKLVPGFTTVAYGLFGCVILIKIFAVLALFNRFSNEGSGGTYAKQASKPLLDDFQNSKEWKRLKLQFWEKVGYGIKCCVPDCSETATHVDHIYPKSKYPERSLDINNLQPMCPEHNRLKSNSIIVDFRPLHERSKNK